MREEEGGWWSALAGCWCVWGPSLSSLGWITPTGRTANGASEKGLEGGVYFHCLLENTNTIASEGKKKTTHPHHDQNT